MKKKGGGGMRERSEVEKGGGMRGRSEEVKMKGDQDINRCNKKTKG